MDRASLAALGSAAIRGVFRRPKFKLAEIVDPCHVCADDHESAADGGGRKAQSVDAAGLRGGPTPPPPPGDPPSFKDNLCEVLNV